MKGFNVIKHYKDYEIELKSFVEQEIEKLNFSNISIVFKNNELVVKSLDEFKLNILYSIVKKYIKDRYKEHYIEFVCDGELVEVY